MKLAMSVDFREQMPHDLERLGWSGGETHLAYLSAAASRVGEVVVLVGELPTGELVASGAVDFTQPLPTLWMLSVRPDWQGLGIGTGLVAALEERIRAMGHAQAALTVEHDNPRARALYLRLGYRPDPTPARVESWNHDDQTRYVTLTTPMTKDL